VFWVVVLYVSEHNLFTYFNTHRFTDETFHKKLSYRRGTARRTMLVNSCFTSYGSCKGFKPSRFQTFKVIQGHWHWFHSIGHIRVSISLPLQLCLYLAPFPRQTKFTEVTWLWTHPFWGVIYYACFHTPLCQSIHESWSAWLTNYKDMTAAKFKKRVTWLWPRPFYGWFVTVGKDLIQSTCVQNLIILASAVPEIWLVPTKI